MPYELKLKEDRFFKPVRINNNGITIYGNETVAIIMDKKEKTEERKLHVVVNNLVVHAGEPFVSVIHF